MHNTLVFRVSSQYFVYVCIVQDEYLLYIYIYTPQCLELYGASPVSNYGLLMPRTSTWLMQQNCHRSLGLCMQLTLMAWMLHIKGWKKPLTLL